MAGTLIAMLDSFPHGIQHESVTAASPMGVERRTGRHNVLGAQICVLRAKSAALPVLFLFDFPVVVQLYHPLSAGIQVQVSPFGEILAARAPPRMTPSFVPSFDISLNAPSSQRGGRTSPAALGIRFSGSVPFSRTFSLLKLPRKRIGLLLSGSRPVQCGSDLDFHI